MLREAAFVLPPGPFTDVLLDVLAGASTAQKIGNEVRFTPLEPPDGQPAFAVRQGPVDFPQVLFEVDRPIQARVGRLRLVSHLDPSPSGDSGPLQDPRLPPPLPFNRLISLLHEGHSSPLIGLDHAGIDLPPDLLPRAQWEQVLADLAAVCNLYRYPEGQDWPFIIPADAREFAGDIVSFSGMREPKFELAYDAFNHIPGLHFHLRTRLPKADLLARLPGPYGFSMAPDATFRTVFVQHPWPGLNLRFDLGFATQDKPTDWDTGEWLVREGGRIR